MRLVAADMSMIKPMSSFPGGFPGSFPGSFTGGFPGGFLGGFPGGFPRSSFSGVFGGRWHPVTCSKRRRINNVVVVVLVVGLIISQSAPTFEIFLALIS